MERRGSCDSSESSAKDGSLQALNGDIELRPSDPNYKSIYIAAGDIGSEEFRIMGKVVRWVDDGIPGNVV